MGEHIFAKTNRLLKAEDFSRVRKKGRRISTKSFTIYTLPNGLETHRLGLSVSKRVGNAVKRNRIKRLLREFFRLNLKAAAGNKTDLFITVKSVESIGSYGDVERELSGALFGKSPE